MLFRSPSGDKPVPTPSSFADDGAVKHPTAGASMTPENLAAEDVFAGDGIRFAIQNPEPQAQPITATSVCLRPDGARQVATTLVLGTRGQVLMPMAVAVAGIYQFSWTLEDADGRRLASGERSISLQPFANDCALLSRALTALRAASDSVEPKLPLTAFALRREAKSLEASARCGWQSWRARLLSLDRGLACWPLKARCGRTAGWTNNCHPRP